LIVIVSEDYDQSTASVIEWLLSLGAEFVRINTDLHIVAEAVDIADASQTVIRVGDKRIPLEDIKSIWFRRGNFNLRFPDLPIPEDFIFKNDLLRNVYSELLTTRDYINYKLLNRTVLGNHSVHINKLIVLDKARKSGLQVPHTLLTSRKDQLLRFKEQHKEIICKAISEAVQFHNEAVGVMLNYTQCVTDETIEKLDDTFHISLFQNKIEKKYELRIFYLDGDFYPMAIFSQLDSRTSLDFRKYNWTKPNRNVPYNLPPRIKESIESLMKSLDLNTGSVDMAVDINNNYIFFEVNPVGQYGMTSTPCNYNLDKKIAEYLINRPDNAEQTGKY
jgi:ATP-GRASP peptide maturase of grasp-with-spasm system